MEIDRIKHIVHQYWGNENPLSDTDFGGMDYQCYSESTADGYEVYVLKPTSDEIVISENVHYYDSNLADELFEILLEGQTVYIDSYLWDDLYMDDRKVTRMVYGYWEIRNIPNQYDMHLKPRNEKRYTIQERCDLGDLLAKHK